ncbi:solute carrier family 35 member G3-like [Acipenser ruthenus]|uniref:solute carrier family 35 member G3-like n=1 Tax=Acipenser ruthenus TaxID=7906 RepID=UPI00274126B8|nr:solute carrier family 35 member G3-like [Acipenser ruthenus]XP_058871285.1 solute carrier family 35 member G3-like [Acipenser ruthenus]
MVDAYHHCPSSSSDEDDESVKEEEKEEEADEDCLPLPRPLHWTGLSDSMKGLLAALLGGGVPAGFVPLFTRIAHESAHLPPLEVLFGRCLLHLLVSAAVPCLRRSSAGQPSFGPRAAWPRLLTHAVVNLLSVGCAYSSFTLVPAGNASAVRKGASTLASVLLALCLGSGPLSCYDCVGLLGSLLGLLVIVLPDLLLSAHSSASTADLFGYALASLGGLALALGLVIFRTFSHPGRFQGAVFSFGALGALICGPAFTLQEPVWPRGPLAWACLVAVACLALAAFLSSNYAVTKAHPALVCALLHSEVVVSMSLQYAMLGEPVTSFDILGAGVIVGSIAVISAQNFSCDPRPPSEKLSC